MIARPWTFVTTGRGWVVLPERCHPRPGDPAFDTRERAEIEVELRNLDADLEIDRIAEEATATAARMGDPTAARAMLRELAQRTADGFLEPPCGAAARRKAALALYAAARLYLNPPPEPDFV